MSANQPCLFCCYRHSPARMEIISADQPGAYRSYLLSGADRLSERGWQLQINLTHPPGTITHHLGVWTSALFHQFGGYGGDFPSCFKNLYHANQSDVVWSTVDTLGIPLTVLKKLKLLKKPLLYTSIGLPERLEGLKDCRLKRWQIKALNTCNAVVCYGWSEAEYLKKTLCVPVHFIPYGVDTETWIPRDIPKSVDVLSLGIDTRRDFAQLLPFARKNPDKRVRIITGKEHQAALKDLPENVEVEMPVPLESLPAEMVAARVIALPVKENSYSGATTTLLQCMAMGLPVVVTEVGAISQGYGFRENDSCRLVPPNRPDLFKETLEQLLHDPAELANMGRRARAHAEKELQWNQFVSRIETVLRSVLPVE